jgi:hypothetical protein
MRSRLFLALLATVPMLCAASPSHAVAQRHRNRYRPARVYVYRDGRGYRDRIFIPVRTWREPVRRVRIDDRRYRDDYRYRDAYVYRDGSRIRRRVNVADLLLLAATRARYNDGYRYRDGYARRTRDRCRHGGRHIRI